MIQITAYFINFLILKDRLKCVKLLILRFFIVTSPQIYVFIKYKLNWSTKVLLMNLDVCRLMQGLLQSFAIFLQ